MQGGGWYDEDESVGDVRRHERRYLQAYGKCGICTIVLSLLLGLHTFVALHCCMNEYMAFSCCISKVHLYMPTLSFLINMSYHSHPLCPSIIIYSTAQLQA